MSTATTDPPRVAAARRHVVVPRPELVGRLHRAVEGRLTSIVAPPGYGKSTLLRQWAADHDGDRVAWLQLGRRDNDGRRLARRLTEACVDADDGVRERIIGEVAQSGQRMGDRLVAALLEALELADPTILVIDAVDSLTNLGLLLDLRALIHNSPPSVRTVVASRFEPDRPWGQQPTTQLGQLDLAFGRADATVLLETICGRGLTERQIDEVLKKTEGWPTALQLTGLALRDGADDDVIIDNLSGADQFIAGYLTEEVLSRQTEPIRRFLLKTSVLSQLSGPLCDALSGESDGDEMVETLARRSIFLTPVGVAGDGFRYHRLFQEFTRHELRVTMPEAEPALQRAAADWHLARGDLDAAVGYLIEAREWERVLDLIVSGGRSLLDRGEVMTVLRWLEQVPSAVRSRRDHLPLAEATLRTMVGATVEAEDIVAQLMHSTSLTAGELAIVNALRATWVQAHASAASAIASANAVLDYLAADSVDQIPDLLGLTAPADLRFLALSSRARSLWYEGLVDRAREDFIALVEADFEREPWNISALGALALLDTWSGRLHDGHQAATRALVGASRADLIGHPSTVDALLAMGSLCRERGQLGRTELLLAQALVPVAHIRRSTVLAIHAAERAALDLAAGEPRRGLERIAAFHASGLRKPPPVVADRLLGVEARLRLAAGDLDAAGRLIATAEIPGTPELCALTVQIAVRSGQPAQARQALLAWPKNATCGAVAHRLWTAVVAGICGDSAQARSSMAEAVALAEPEGYVRMFYEAGPEALRLLRSLHRSHPRPYLRRILDHDPSDAPTAEGDAVTLSRRELVVLRYLPSQLSNTELAAQLYVSQNTVKTHLRSIYRRLDVSGRREAVEKAERLGFL